MKLEKDFIFPIYIKKKVIDDIVQICKQHEHEIFGYLVGKRHAWKEKEYILISHYLYKEESSAGTQYNVYEQGGSGVAVDSRDKEDTVQFNFMEYSGEFDKLREKIKDDSVLRLGWWHSHPDFGCFLSSTDLDTQRATWNEPYHVALVVDPIRDYFEFFTLDKEAEEGYVELSYAIIS